MNEKEKSDSGSRKTPGFVKLRLKTLIRTDEAFLVDLGEGKVWIPREEIKSRRRLSQGILEIEVREEVIKNKRKEMRGLKEKATGVKGSVMGEVVEVRGKLLSEVPDALRIEFEGKDLYIPRVCFSDREELPDGSWRFVVQKNYLDYKLRLLESAEAGEAFITVPVAILRETDRAYLFAHEGAEVWFPKREVMEIKEAGDKWKIKVPADFWKFKLEGGSI